MSGAGVPTMRCEWCACEVSSAATSCPSCGGPHLRVLAPTIVLCGWCGNANYRDQSSVCRACGGPLPALPGGNPGPRPPGAPRALPLGYRERVIFWKNVPVILGAIFTVFFFWTLIFLAAGIFLLRLGLTRARNWLDALEQGVATSGRLLSVAVDETETMNGEHPLALSYEYDTPAGTKTATIQVWDRSHLNRPKGEHLWVVYVPERPEAVAPWPPLK